MTEDPALRVHRRIVAGGAITIAILATLLFAGRLAELVGLQATLGRRSHEGE
jgi:hypothetical protein